jgi:hypothetical protein
MPTISVPAILKKAGAQHQQSGGVRNAVAECLRLGAVVVGAGVRSPLDGGRATISLLHRESSNFDAPGLGGEWCANTAPASAGALSLVT